MGCTVPAQQRPPSAVEITVKARLDLNKSVTITHTNTHRRKKTLQSNPKVCPRVVYMNFSENGSRHHIIHNPEVCQTPLKHIGLFSPVDYLCYTISLAQL